MAKVCIDAGHFGKYNRSPVNAAYYESERMWKLHEYLAVELMRRGVSVVKTRALQAKDMELTARGKKARGCDLFISLHSNAASAEGPDYPVAMVLREDNKTTLDERSEQIGLKLARVVQTVMGTRQEARTATRAASGDRDGNGYKDDEYYGVLHGCKSVKVPGIILEHSFHTNRAATAWLLEDDNLAILAAAEAEAICDWLNVKTQPSVQKPGTAQPGASAAAFRVKVTASELNIRKGPGMSYKVVGSIKDKGVYTITETSSIWGKLKSGAGWISLNYCKRL